MPSSSASLPVQRRLNHEQFTYVSKVDERQYRYIQLANGLKVLLVSDVSTLESAAAMDVSVGYYSDPEDLPGLAHFLEHMLFLGTEKYPDENAYSSFLASHGGYDNAFTDKENTNFQFAVLADFLEPALDIFAQFFISPLFTSSATNREIHAVDSEDNKNKQDDKCRVDELSHNICLSSHPLKKFGCGNKKTLLDIPLTKNIDTVEELKKFYCMHYSPEKFSLCVLGKESLDGLEAMVVSRFSLIKKQVKTLPVLHVSNNVFDKTFLPCLQLVLPVKECHVLELTWCVPSDVERYHTKPAGFVAFLLGDEGIGSLLSHYKACGLASSVTTDIGYSSTFSTLHCRVTCSDKVLDDWPRIVELIYVYINIIKNCEDLLPYFNDYQRLGKLNYDYKEKEEPYSYVEEISNNMNRYNNVSDALSANYLLYTYDEQQVRETLNCLTVDTMLLQIISSNVDSDKLSSTCEWYGTRYGSSLLPADIIHRCKSPSSESFFSLPILNPFIPNNTDIIVDDSGVDTVLPIRVSDGPMHRIWYKKDEKFHEPRVHCGVDLITTNVNSNVGESVQCTLLCRCLESVLNEYAYAASLAGLHFSFSNVGYGMQLWVYGFNDKLHLLVNTVIDKLVTFNETYLSQTNFNIIKEKFCLDIKNQNFKAPYKHSRHLTDLLLKSRVWSVEEKYNVAVSLTLVDVINYSKFFRQENVFCELFIYGNYSLKKSIDLGHSIVNDVKSPKGVTEFPSICRLVSKSSIKSTIYPYLIENRDDPNHCISCWIEIGENNIDNNVLCGILEQLISDALFHRLRTIEQLGYIIFTSFDTLRGIASLRFTIQSAKYNPLYLDHRLELCLMHINEYLLNYFTDEEFEKFRSTYILKKLDKPKQLSSQCNQYWTEISMRRYLFSYPDLLIERAKLVKKSDVVDLFTSAISRTKGTGHGGEDHSLNFRRRLCIWMFGKGYKMLPSSNNFHTFTTDFGTIINEKRASCKKDDDDDDDDGNSKDDENDEEDEEVEDEDEDDDDDKDEDEDAEENDKQMDSLDDDETVMVVDGVSDAGLSKYLHSFDKDSYDSILSFSEFLKNAAKTMNFIDNLDFFRSENNYSENCMSWPIENLKL